MDMDMDLQKVIHIQMDLIHVDRTFHYCPRHGREHGTGLENNVLVYAGH